MKNFGFSKKSFTLVEMLLVTSLIAVIGVAVFHSLADGLKIWEAAKVSAKEEDVALFFDKLSQDLHNATEYSLLKFDGNDDKLSFATIVRTMDPGESLSPEVVSQIGRVEYEFDQVRNVLLRRQAGYGQALAKKFDPPRPLVEAVSFVKFSYYVMDAGRVSLTDRPRDGQWPVAVFVQVGFPAAGQGDQINTMSKTISIPSGNYL